MNKSPKSIKSSLSEMFSNFQTKEKENKEKELEIFLLVRIKADCHEDRIKDLKIYIHTQGLTNITITDPDDPLFLFKSSISESDFHQIKQQQNLVFDYVQFPYKILEMLELCKDNNNQSVSMKSIFYCVIEQKGGECYLLIQEHTHLRIIDYLKLSIKIPNDEIVKKHLNVLCKSFKSKYEAKEEESKNLYNEIENLKFTIIKNQEESKKTIEDKNNEISEKTKSAEKLIEEINLKHKEEIFKITTQKESNDREISKELKTQKDALDEFKLLLDREREEKNSLSSLLSQLKISNENTSKQLTIYKDENEKLRLENKELTGNLYLIEKEKTSIEVKLQSSSQSIFDKEQIFKNYVEQIETLKNQIVNFLLD